MLVDAVDRGVVERRQADEQRRIGAGRQVARPARPAPTAPHFAAQPPHDVHSVRRTASGPGRPARIDGRRRHRAEARRSAVRHSASPCTALVASTDRRPGRDSTTGRPSTSHSTAGCWPCQRTANDSRRSSGRRRGRGPRRRPRATRPGCRPGTARRRAAAAVRPPRRPRDAVGGRRLEPGRRRPADDAGDVDDGPPLAGRGEHDGRGAERGVDLPARRGASTLHDAPPRPATDVGRRASASSPEPHQLADAEQEADRVLAAVGRPTEEQLAPRRDDGLDRRRVRELEPAGPLGTSPTQPRATASASTAGRSGRRPRPSRRGPGRRSRTPGGRSAARSWSRRQVDALDRHVGRRAGSCAGRPVVNAQAIGSGDSLVDLHAPSARRRRRPTTPGARRRRRAPQPGLEHRGPGEASLAHRHLVRPAVPPVVGGDVPVERRRAVPRHDRALRRDVGPPRLTEHSGDTRTVHGRDDTDDRPVRVVAVEAAVLIPVKRFTAAKGRLAGLLDVDAARRARPLAGRPRRRRRRRSARVRRLRRRRRRVVGRRRRRRGAVEPGPRAQRRRRRRPGDDRRQGLRPPRHRPQRPPLAHDLVPLATAAHDHARPRPPSRRHERAAPARRRAPIPASYGARLVQPPPRAGDGRRAAASRCGADPRLAIDVDNPDDLAHPTVEPILPAWLRTILANPSLTVGRIGG